MNLHPSRLDEIRRIVAEARAVDPDDEQLVDDMLEGETDFGQIVASLLQERQEALASKGAMEDLAAIYTAKARTWGERAERIGKALGQLRDILGQNIRHPMGTVIVSERKPDVELAPDFDVDALPYDLVRTKHSPDMAKIKEAVKAGRNVPGVRWGEPKRVVTVR